MPEFGMELAVAGPLMVIGFGIWPRTEANWVVLAARSTPDARLVFLDDLLEKREVPVCDLLIIDGEKPGPQFVELYKAHVNSVGIRPMLVLGTAADPVLRLVPWEEHLTVFLPKPYRLEDIKRALQSVIKKAKDSQDAETSSARDEKVTPRPLDYLSSLQLFDLIQMLCINRWSGMVKVLRLSTGDRGEVCVVNGEIIHAATGGIAGEEAFYGMVTWGRCELGLEERHQPVAQTITLAWQHLLLEGAHRKDELDARIPGTA
jgi:hypothetical protein